MDLAEFHRHRTAEHEAAHAVMHVFLRMDNLDRISIIGKGDSAGRVESRFMLSLDIVESPEGHSWRAVRYHRMQVRKRLLMVLAGYIANGVTLRHTDLKLAQYLGRIIAPKGARKRLLQRYSAITKRLVRGPLKSAIMAFAATLLEREEIDGWEAHEMICATLGIDPENYWRPGPKLIPGVDYEVAEDPA